MTLVARPQENERYDQTARAGADYQLESMFEWAKDGAAEPFPLTLAAHATMELIIAATIEALGWQEKNACPGCGCTNDDACSIGESEEPCSWTALENDFGYPYCSACVIEVVDDGSPD